MNKLIPLFAATAALALAVAGCASDASDTPADEATDTSSDELHTSLTGMWTGGGTLVRLELTRERASTLGGWRGYVFNATIDNGIRCITTPCPSTDEVSGVYRADWGRMTLQSYDRPSLAFSKILGSYRYSRRGNTLSLHKTDGTLDETLTRAQRCGRSYCGEGTVCCNPLMGICTPPGGVCIQ
jgi:hypothetical protein